MIRILRNFTRKSGVFVYVAVGCLSVSLLLADAAISAPLGVLGASGTSAVSAVIAQLEARATKQQRILRAARDAAQGLQMQSLTFKVLAARQRYSLAITLAALVTEANFTALAAERDHQLETALALSETQISNVGATERQLAAFQLAASQEAQRNAQLQGTARGGAPASYGWGGDFTHAVTAASLNTYLRNHGSPMVGSGAALIRSGTHWNVDPRLIVAIAGAESNFGQITCAPHNAWGWACPSSPASFSSWDSAIDTVTHGLRSNYLDLGLRSVSQIQRSYAPSHATNDPTGLNLLWSLNVSEFLVEQGGNPANVQGSKIAAGLTGVD